MSDKKFNLLIGAGLILVFLFLLFNSSGTLSMVETLSVYALGAAAGYFIMTSAVKLTTS